MNAVVISGVIICHVFQCKKQGAYDTTSNGQFKINWNKYLNMQDVVMLWISVLMNTADAASQHKFKKETDTSREKFFITFVLSWNVQAWDP